MQIFSENIFYVSTMSFRNETKRRSVNVYAKAEEYSARAVFDKWGYVYMHTGEWEKAEEQFIAGMQHEDCEELSTYLLSQLYANKGEQKRAIQLIDDAIVKFPQVPYFHFEKIKYLLDLEQYEEMLAVIDNINTQLPYHAYNTYFVHLRAEALYKMNKFADLQKLLKEEKSLKESLYHNLEKIRMEKRFTCR